jgi:uncharacterized protein
MDGEFSFSAAELDRGGKAFRFPLTAKWLQTALEARSPDALELQPKVGQPAAELAPIEAGPRDGEVLVRASRSEKEVIVHGSATASVHLSCARCTTPFDVDLAIEIAALYVPKSKLKKVTAPDYEFSSEEADVESYEGDIVILDELILDSLLLDIPMIPLCSEDCPGMTPLPVDTQGTDKPDEPAIDPRLLPLMRFKGSA